MSRRLSDDYFVFLPVPSFLPPLISCFAPVSLLVADESVDDSVAPFVVGPSSPFLWPFETFADAVVVSFRVPRTST